MEGGGGLYTLLGGSQGATEVMRNMAFLYSLTQMFLQMNSVLQNYA